MENFSFYVQDIGKYAEEFRNDCDFYIYQVSALNELKENSLFFVNKAMSDILWERICKCKHCLMILKKEDNAFDYSTLKNENFVILSDNPRLDFAKIFRFVLDASSEQKIAMPTQIGKNFSRGEFVVIKENTLIGDNVRIDDRVSIGKNVNIGNCCHIMSGAVIKDNVTIGDYCIIRENCVIGGWGFGFSRDEHDVPIRLPHVGGVTIGNYVEVGALSTIVSGTFSPTIIGDYTKIDDHAHIAHNCSVGQKCYVMAGAILCGSVKIGDRCHVAPQSVIIDGGIVIGDDCTVGIGSVVKKSINESITVSGNPAKSLIELGQERLLYNFLKRRFRDEYPNY